MDAVGTATARGGARERMVRSAAALFRERGIEATALSDVIAHSGAPRGSIYHHFPGGKAQLAEEATAYAGDVVARGLAASLDSGDAVGALRSLADAWRAALPAGDWAAGCPVVAAALEGERCPGAATAAGAAFDRWRTLLADALRRDGVAPARADSLATTAVAAIEGAIVLARAQRSNRPLDDVAAEIERLLVAALPGAGG